MKALQNITVCSAETVTNCHALWLLVVAQLVSDCNQLSPRSSRDDTISKNMEEMGI